MKSHRVKHEVAIETAEKIKKKLIREAVKTYLRSDPRKLGGRTLFDNSIKAIKKGESYNFCSPNPVTCNS